MKTTNPTKTSADNRSSHRLNKQFVKRLNKQFVKRTSLPFVIVLALIGAAIATGLTIGNRRQKTGIASSAQQHKSAARVGDLSPTSQPKTAAVDPATLRPTDLGTSVGLENKFASSGIAPTAKPTTTVASTSIPQVVEMTIGEDEEQSSQNSPVLRSARIPYSSAAANSGERDRDREQSQDQDARRVQRGESVATNQNPERPIDGKPREERLIKAHEFKGDLRRLPRTRPPQRERRELEPPAMNPRLYVPPGGVSPQSQTPEQGPAITPQANAPAPPTTNVFEGLDRLNWGAGSPPDTNGDVGPNYFIQTVNTSVGIFRKTDGFEEAAFTFNTFMSQGNFGNLCDTDNFGDPVVVYDTFNDRWIITDFAFKLDGNNDVLAPAFQCIAASQGSNPLTGGWNFYSRQLTDNLNDYPKFGIWPDGLYMSANMFSFGAGSTFRNARVWAFNKDQMYAGRPIVNVVSFDVGGGDFTVIPSNARLQTGTPPPGRPNLFASTEVFLNALTIYKFHVDWNDIALSTFTGPDTPLAATSWPNANVASAPQPGTANLIDVLPIRAMVQNQYTNFGGTESLWLPHTVRRVNTGGAAAPRWYQVNVTGGTVAANLPQATTWDPDGNNTNHRFMPSLALDRAGNLNMGYSISNSASIFPSMRYAGRLAADPVNTFSQTEQTFFTGTASQTTSTRWGDYSSMTLDPDGCTFWITNEYANPASQAINQRWLTKFGSIGAFPGCTPVGAGGTVSGTVTVNPGGAPISGATVNLGARSTTTDGSGNYSFTGIPAGTYPSIDASFPGFVSASASSIVVTDGNTTAQDLSLTDAADSACLTDTTQSNFLAGSPTSTLDLTTSPGDVTLANPIFIDQLNTAGTMTGTGFGTPAWTGQTFIPAVTGLIMKADVQLFCSGCGATPPNLTLSVRATSAGLPTGADLATATIPGSTFASGAITTFTATFGSPATLTSGTQYALVLRPVSAPAGSGYFWIRSSPTTYASGSRVLSADNGATWSADSTRDYNFRTYMQTGYAASSSLISSTKDANPGTGITPIWSTFSWNDSTPANTSLQFQVAGSNNVNGPFNFVGPDGTAGTFFTTSPVNLQPQFYNFRYLAYKAYLATTDGSVTPTLNDATLCINDVDCSSTPATITPTPSSVCPNSVGNTASGPAGMTSYSWGITNGTITSATNTQSITYTGGASGSVNLTLTVTAPNGCIVSGAQPVTINPTPATPTITPGGPTTFCQGGSVSLSSSSATGDQWYLNGNPIGGATNQVYVATASGNYTVVVTDGNGCASAASATTTVTVNPLPPTPTITPGGPTTFCQGGSVNLSSSSATGNQWYLNGNPIGGATNQVFSANASGNYTVVVTDGNSCVSAPSTATTVTVNPNPNATIATAAQECTGSTGNTASVANAGVGATYNWSITNGTITGGTGTANITYTAGAAGTLTLNLTVTTAASCSDTKSANVTINAIPAKPTITPGGPTTFPSGGSVTLNSSSATGNQWFLNGNPIGGATNSSYVANAAGNYTVVVTTNGCSSPASDATTVTICVSAPVVTNTNDSGAGSLRQAIIDACPGSTLTFESGAGQAFDPATAPHTITLTSGELAIGKALTITGPGANVLTISGNNASRVFNIASGTVTISALTVANGKAPAGGSAGGVLNAGTLTLNDCSITGNTAPVAAGGIENNGANGSATMTINGCTISGNVGSSFGSGVMNTGFNGNAVLNVRNTTITGNGNTSFGGGIYNDGNSGVATLNLTNSTISGNNAGSSGGGIYNFGNGGNGTININNTIVSDNTGVNAANGPDIFNFNGTIAGSNNIIRTSTGYSITGSSNSNVDPQLEKDGLGNLVLKNNGGPTRTLLPLTGSPAINAGNNTQSSNAGLTTDQRGAGFNRIVDTTVDIGAVEVNYSVTATAGSNQSAPINTAFATALQATVKESNVVQNNVAVTFTPPASGASGAFSSSSTVNTNASGVATAPTFTANGTAGGPYNVVASLAGNLATANFAFTNALGNQTITVNTHAPSSAVFNASFTVAATASSGLPVSYSSGGSCTNVGATFTMTSGAGTCNVTYSQGGNANYNAAPPLSETVNGQQANQTITFNALANRTFGDADFTVSATASSGLPVSFTAGGNCTISTNTVHLTGAGSCTITAKQAGNSNFNAAPDVPRTFTIAQAATTTAVSSSANPSNLTQSVTFNATVSGPAGTGTPTGTVTFKDGAAIIICANAGGQTLNGSGVATCQTSALTAGTHTITAVYSGDTNFLTSTGTLSPNQGVNNLPLVSFSAANYNVNESDGVVHVIVARGGDTTVPFNVGYATSDTGASTNCAALNTGLASSICDYTAFSGTLSFAANQTTANIDIPINQDSYTEGPESFTATLSNATNGAVLFGPATTIITISDSAPPAPNAIDDNTAFVRQHYHDFLNREPDAAGLAFWVTGLNDCADPAKRPVGQTQAQCLEVRRVLTSSAFFLSIEFMQTGTFVRSFYVAALNRPLPPSANATDNLPSFSEWLRDTQAVQRGVIVNQGNWQATLDANRLAFMQDFVKRTEFVGLYPTTDAPAQYINKLYSHALSRTPTATELSDALSLFGGAPTASDATARGQALLKVTQASDFISREIPRAFVQFEYFGYLRRNPNDAPDNNFNGYNFWLNKLTLAGGDFLKAEMVKAFINSPEYRQRFGSQ